MALKWLKTRTYQTFPSNYVLTFPNFFSKHILWSRKKWRKRFFVSKIFSLILPKKHGLIIQKRFWPFFGVFSGFLGVPQNYIIWLFKSVFWQFLREKNGRKSRDLARPLVKLFSRSAHQNCLIFCSKVNLGNTYKFAIYILLGKFLIPLNPLKMTQICPKMHNISLYVDDEA